MLVEQGEVLFKTYLADFCKMTNDWHSQICGYNTITTRNFIVRHRPTIANYIRRNSANGLDTLTESLVTLVFKGRVLMMLLYFFLPFKRNIVEESYTHVSKNRMTHLS